MPELITGSVTEVRDRDTVTLNVGSEHGVEIGMRFMLQVDGRQVAVKVIAVREFTATARRFIAFADPDNASDLIAGALAGAAIGALAGRESGEALTSIAGGAAVGAAATAAMMYINRVAITTGTPARQAVPGAGLPQITDVLATEPELAS